MKKYNFLVMPYRDLYFLQKYGPAVRDTQIIEALAVLDQVDSITVVNRPVSVYERVLSKKRPKNLSRGKIHYLDRTSTDLMGPLRGRKWFVDCYKEFANLNFYKEDMVNVILDFLPLGGVDYNQLRYDFLWYDLIDNFTRHNRFDDEERILVAEKYRVVGSRVDLITGVSRASIETFEAGKVLPNAAGIDIAPIEIDATPRSDASDFGFIGFITNKFDVGLIKRLAAVGHTVAIHGEFYDKAVQRELAAVAGVRLTGKFCHSDIPSLVGTFKVGLIPYLTNLLHDESPLKLYQYLLHGRPVLTSTPYELVGPAIGCYKGMSEPDTLGLARHLLLKASTQAGRIEAAAMIGEQHFWAYKLRALLKAHFV